LVVGYASAIERRTEDNPKMPTTAREPTTSGETVDADPVVSKPPKKKVEPLVFSDDAVDGLAQVFQNRAGDAKRTASIGLAVTIVIGGLILSLFIFSSLITRDVTLPESPT
jgi:hypothetical protein